MNDKEYEFWREKFNEFLIDKGCYQDFYDEIKRCGWIQDKDCKPKYFITDAFEWQSTFSKAHNWEDLHFEWIGKIKDIEKTEQAQLEELKRIFKENQ